MRLPPVGVRKHLDAMWLAVLAYIPALTSAPGRMPSDTKLFLYLDPGRLISDAPWTWDARQFAGWVPHQTIAYLWPSGPWFWLWDTLRMPDWIAHRLWIGTLLFAGGLGARSAARQMGVLGAGALVAAMVYQLSPYVLPYISRTSVMLLPWAGLGWLIGLTMRAATSNRWRYAAAFALVVLTVGAVNATATAMIAPAPVLWLIHAASIRTITWKRAATTAAKLGGLSLAVSTWWIGMLTAQGRYGADVLAYSETLQAVSLTSSATEVARGTGYWLFYVRDPVAFATSASERYMLSTLSVAISFALVLAGFAGLALTRWRERRFAVFLVGIGVVLAVGVHPIDDPSPLMSPVADASRSTIALAMRSSTRALPLVVMGLALATGALVTSLGTRGFGRWRHAAPWLAGALAVANLPVLWSGGVVDTALARDENPPDAWRQAADALDATSDEYRVLQVPGAEFGAFRWGYTVDAPLPGMTTKPLVTRDLLPLGSPAAMDLLYALDDRFQNGTIDPAAIAPIARLLGVDTVWVPGDIAFDRFRLPRPELTAELFAARPDGLGVPTAYGTPAPNIAALPMLDETALSDPAVGSFVAPVGLVPVDRATAIVRAKTTTIVVAGSGDGLVDAAAAGILDGSEAVLYAAELSPSVLADAVGSADLVVVTDSNRDRAHHWRSSQDVWGFTETGGREPGVLAFDSADQRLPVFPDETAANQTIAEQRGSVTTAASAYGEPYAYRPEDRAAMAIDGDPTTAWVVADHDNPLGQFIEVTARSAAQTLTVVQPLDPATNRWITAVDVTVDGMSAGRFPLDDSSRTATGQVLTLPMAGTTIRLSVATLGELVRPSAPGVDAVGFAEVRAGDAAPTEEVVRVPTDALDHVRADDPLAIVLTRLRTDPLNRWRSDPEPRLLRAFTLPTDRQATVTATVRLDRRASDQVLAELLGIDGGAASERLAGVPAAGGWAAVDGDPATAWQTAIAAGPGATLTAALDPAAPITTLTLNQLLDDRHSAATAVRLSAGGQTRDVTLPPADAGGTSTLTFDALQGDELSVQITEVDMRTTPDRRTGEPVALPVAITELSGEGITAHPLPDSFDTGCRSDLLTVDGTPVTVRVSATIADAFSGRELVVDLCDTAPLQLSAGEHIVRTSAGALTGLDVDRVTLTSDAASQAVAAASDAAPPSTVVVSRTRTERVVDVGQCPQGCWLILGEGFNDGWKATGPDGSLGEPTLIDGGFNGWWLPPSESARTVTFSWTPQRLVTIGLALTIAGVLACLVLLAIDRSRAVPTPVNAPVLAFTRRRVPWRRALLAWGAIAIGAALCIGPRFGVLALAAGAVACGWLRRPQLLSWGALAMAGVIVGRIVLRVHRYHPFPSPTWVLAFDDLHRPMLFALAALVAGVLGSPDTEVERE